MGRRFATSLLLVFFLSGIASAQIRQHHDYLNGYIADQHVDWTVTGAEDIHEDRLPASSYDASNVAITGGTISGVTPVGIGGDTVVDYPLTMYQTADSKGVVLGGFTDPTATGALAIESNGDFLIQASANERIQLSANGDLADSVYIDTNSDLILYSDNQAIAFGAASRTDSYIEWDTANLEVYSSGGIELLGTVGIGGVPVATYPLSLYQTADSKGFKLFGYDDKSTSYFHGYITAGGTLSLLASSSINFYSAGGSYYTNLASNGTFGLLNDNQRMVWGAAGAADSYIKWDTANLEVYSSGGIELLGNVSIGGVPVADYLLTAYQSADSKGIKLFGFDDQSGASAEIFVDANGFSYFDSSGRFYMVAGAQYWLFGTDGVWGGAADGMKSTWGAAGESDSYAEWDTVNLDIYSSGVIDLLAPVSIGGGAVRTSTALDVQAGRITLDREFGLYWNNGATLSSAIINNVSSDILFYTVGGNLRMTLVADGDLVLASGRVTQEGCFAEIYCHDSSAAVTVATGVSYVKMTQFTSDGESANCTPAAASDVITITQTGRYVVAGSVSFTCDTNNTTILMSVFLNGVEQDKIHFRRKIGTAGDEGTCPVTGVIDVTSVPWDLDLRARHDDGGDVDITITYANLLVHYLGET